MTTPDPLHLDAVPRWGEVGIHGIHRPREWDEVATVRVDGVSNDEVVAVVLASDKVVVEEGDPGTAFTDLLSALRLAPPFRVHLLRRDDGVWAAGARRITVVELAHDPGGSVIEVAWDGHERAVRVDGAPRLVEVPEFGVVRAGRVEPYAATLRRIEGATWEVETAPL